MWFRSSADKNLVIVPSQDPVLMVGDILLVQGNSQNILKVSEELGLEAIPEWKFDELNQGSQTLVEVTLSPKSSIQCQTLKETDFQSSLRFDGAGNSASGRIDLLEFS